MPAVKTGFTPPPMPGMPAPMQPMGGMPPMPPMGGAPAQNPFIPMPPAPLAGMPTPPASQVQQQQVMGSNAGRRRRFGDALEGMMGGLGGAAQGGRSFAPPQMVPRQQMVAPGTPMMRTPTPRPMADGGIVRGYDAGGGVESISSGGIGPDAYIGPSSGAEFVVVNPGPGSGVAIASQGMKDSGIVTDTSTGQEVVVHSGLSDLLNTFNPSTATYSIRDLDSGGTEQYTVGETYDDLPADVAYSKQVQENREKLGLAGNDSSAWAMYQRGEHWSQSQPASAGDSVDDSVVDEVISQPVTSIVGSGSGAGTGAGSAVGSGGNFGTGTYVADIVDDSQVGDIDYGQFAGDIGKFEGSQEKSALYGPKINIPQRVSQYYTDPLTGGLGTTYGPMMTAISPIGAINLPARPVSLDINNFLSTPTYGTLYSGIAPVGDADYGFNRFGEVDRFADGGEVEMTDMSGGKNESLGNDMVMLTFADGTKRQTQKALYEAAKDLGALENMESGQDFADWHLNEWAGKVVSDPEYIAAHDKFNTNQIAYNQALMDANPEIAKNRLAFTQQYAGGNQAAMAAAQELYDKYYGDNKVSGVDQITGDQSGAGTAAGADGNFGTGSYDDSGYDQSGSVNYGDYIGSIAPITGGYEDGQQTAEMSSLYGPNINIPRKVSQYMTDPVTGGMTTTYGSEMGAVSPIGGILLPARPVDLDIFDFLSTPTYGTMYSGVEGMRDGGEVPRQTMIGDQPHMLAYINPQEAALLKGLGGSGEPGPGGIPAYKWSWSTSSLNPKNWGGGSSTTSSSSGRDRDADAFAGSNYAPTSNAGTSEAKQTFTNVHTGETFDTAYDLHSSYGINDDDGPSTPSSSNVTPVPTGVVEITLPPTPDNPNPPVIAEIDYGDGGDDSPVIKDVTYYDDTGVNEIAPPIVDVAPVYVDPTPAPPPAPPPVYTDRFGREYSSQEAADAADRAYAAQLASYGAGKEGFNRFADQASAPYISREESDRAASRIYTDSFRPELAQYDGPEIIGGLPSYNIPGVGGGDVPAVGGGVSPIEIIDPTVMPDQVDIFELPVPPESVPSLNTASAVNLNAPVRVDDEDYTPTAAEMAAQLAAQGRTNVTQGPMSVAEQISQYRPETDMMDLFDIERERNADIAAEQALNRIKRGDSGAQTPSTATVAPDDKPAASTQTAASTTSQDLKKGLGTGTGTETDTGTPSTAGMFAKKPGESSAEYSARMREMANMRPGETYEEYMARVTSQPTTPRQLTDEEAAKLKDLYDRGLNPDDDPRRANLAVNAAEAQYLQNLLEQFEFDKDGKMVAREPNFIEKVLGQIGKNLTLGLLDINKMDREQAQKVIDAYRKTGSFVYDTEGKAIDLKTVEDLEKLEKMSAGRGQEPAVIGVRDGEGEIVSYGPDVKNTPEGPVEVDIFETMTMTGDGEDTKNYTIGEDGTIICNQEGYVYSEAAGMCVPADEVEGGDETDTGTPTIGIGRGTPARSFEDVLAGITSPAPRIAPISENIRPMQAGGMVGLNRAADNFLKALAG